MARVLADKEIRKLIGTVLIDADLDRINPNGIELRLGRHVLFQSTGEEKEISPEFYLKISPGETVMISSMEKIDFTTATVEKLFPHCMLMGLITPTTTMMREGTLQAATKIDAGWRGALNWGLRNSSAKDLILQNGDPIFKLTVFLLEAEEVPEIPYGVRETDYYQDTEGIKRSARRLPADIPKNKIVASSFEKLDPKMQLREAGYPFSYISTELMELHGKFEVVSTDFARLKEDFQKGKEELRSKIESETQTLSQRVEQSKQTLLRRVEALFGQKFGQIVGVLIGALATMYGGVTFLQEGTTLSRNTIGFIAVVAGIAILFVTYILTRKSAKSDLE
ncbi:MAG: hypothetical protein HY649_05450 [Acidobacteria bacterium]|nr:hypothetical protein [Acidobacteriota bacterium]